MNGPLALVIEDEEDLAQIFSSAMEAAGFTTEVILRGDTALTRLEQVVPKVVVLDLNLPGVDGRKLLRKIHADERLADTKVIVATADSAMFQALDDVQADLMLLKPISFSQLRDLTKRLFSD